MMKITASFYLCPVCFTASEHRDRCHDHEMILFDPGNPEDLRRKPLVDGEGKLRSQAPRWFLEGIGWIAEESSSLL